MPPILVSNDPRTVEWVLKTNFENYEKGPLFFENQRPLLGHGIFNADGDTWRVQRKTASYLFHVKNFRDFMLKVFAEHTDDLTARIDTAAATGSVIDLYDLLHRFTLDAFMEIGFGTPVHSLRSDEQLPFAVAFDRAQNITSARMTMSPVQRIVTEAITGEARELNACVKVTDEFAKTVIRQRRAQMAAAGSDSELPADLLSRFLNMKQADGTPYSDADLRDTVMNFVIAGRDTTAQGLSWAFFLLSKHPAVLAKIRAEITQVLGDEFHLGATEQDYAALTRQMPYTKAVFFEALRLYPSVPMEIKAAVHADTLPDGTRVNPGDRIVWAPYAMARLPEVWGPDAEQFKPERFLDEQGGFVQPNPFKYPVFNAGPRCAWDMATMEGMACLVTLVHNYDFEVVKPEEVVYKVALTCK
ncbi:cytochrome P450 [Catenaria anguillulae PL171]|uniref:Cytochrome P450 n=1 Tax=Catenaria anguillulae PL171 TaxID=765915 RepID=A0A1Y2HSI2_9FUNG|nr:cytochrome P450 [Catenaria anguillulae PL171]